MIETDDLSELNPAGHAGASTVRTVEIAGFTIVIECRADGTVLVNGDEVEPAAVTVERFRAGG